jgi:hypothetical protein
MEQERPWSAASILRSTSAELERNAIFRALASELDANLGARSPEDQALLILVPEVLRSVQTFYAGQGPALHERISSAGIRILDAWLSSEIRYWAGRWQALDPTRRGSAVSTRTALDALALELQSRTVPEDVASLVAWLTPGSVGPTPAWLGQAARAVHSWLQHNLARFAILP